MKSMIIAVFCFCAYMEQAHATADEQEGRPHIRNEITGSRYYRYYNDDGTMKPL